MSIYAPFHNKREHTKNEEGKVSKLFLPCHIDKDRNEGATDEEKNYPNLKKEKLASSIKLAPSIKLALSIKPTSSFKPASSFE